MPRVGLTSVADVIEFAVDSSALFFSGVKKLYGRVADSIQELLCVHAQHSQRPLKMVRERTNKQDGV